MFGRKGNMITQEQANAIVRADRLGKARQDAIRSVTSDLISALASLNGDKGSNELERAGVLVSVALEKIQRALSVN